MKEKKRNNKIKVAHILHSVGGVDIYLRTILQFSDPDMFEHIVIHNYDEERLDYDFKASFKEYFIPIKREINVFRDSKIVLQCIKILKNENPNIVHAHSAKAGIIGRIASSICGIPVLYTPHAYSFLSSKSLLKRKVYLAMERAFRSSNSLVLATSKSEERRAINQVGYPKNRVLLFINSISPITKIKELAIDLDLPKNYLCTVARPSYQKNLEFMVEVLYELKKRNIHIHLIIMGVGYYAPNLKSIKKEIANYKLESQITLLPWTSREDVYHIINHSQLYISTSRYEGLPYSMIEALALGKPIVATDVDGNKELVINEYNGYLIDTNNSIIFAKAILKILNDDQLKMKFSRNAISLFQDYFDITKNISKLEKIYYSNSKF